METITVRCSSLPLAMACPASTVPVHPRIDGQTAAADLGSAVHHLLALGIRGEHPEVSDVAAMFGVETDELEPLARWAWFAWQRMSRHFPDPQTEVELERTVDVPGVGTVRVTGHADVLSPVDIPSVLDFKSGRLDSNHDDQVRGYGWLALGRYPDADSVRSAVLRIRDQTVDGATYTREELDHWFNRLVAGLATRNDRFQPGRHCGHCPRAYTCPGFRQAFDQARGLLLGLDAEILDLPGSREALGAVCGAIVDSVSLVAGIAERARETVRSLVAQNGGTLPIGDGRKLQLCESQRREIAFDKGWPVLESQGVASAELKAAIRIPKTAVETAAKETAGRGQKGKRIKEVLDALDVAGAVTINRFTKLEVRRDVNDSAATAALAGPGTSEAG